MVYASMTCKANNNNRMTIQDLGSLGELIAAIATIATLVYLAIQIRQNTTSSRTSTYQSIVSTGIELGITFARDESFADIFARGAANPERLTPAEAIRLRGHISSVFRCYELVFHQYEQGAIEADVWEGWRLNMVRFLRLAAYSQAWEKTRDEYPVKFRREADTALKESKESSR